MKQIYRLASIFMILMLLSTVVIAAIQTTTNVGSQENSVQSISSHKNTTPIWDVKLCSVNSQNKVEHCGDSVFNIPKNRDYVKMRVIFTYRNPPPTLPGVLHIWWYGDYISPVYNYRLHYKGTITNTIKIYKPGLYYLRLGEIMPPMAARFTIK